MRYHFIDIAKGIGITLVVLFHVPDINQVSYIDNFNWGGYITTFYMPLFFFLSGLFFNPSKIKKRVIQLLYPYVSFILIGALLYVAKRALSGEAFSWSAVYAPFIGKTLGYPNTPCWFLLSLMQVDIIAYLLQKIEKKYIILFLSLLVSVIGYIWGSFVSDVRYYTDVAMLCTLFFTIGYLFKDVLIGKVTVMTGAFCLAVSIMIYVIWPGTCNVSQNYIEGGYIRFVMLASLASLGVIGLSKAMERTKVGLILEFYGRNSLIVLCTHCILIPIVFKLVLKITSLPSLRAITGLALVMFVEVPLIYIINNYAPVLIGKNRTHH